METVKVRTETGVLTWGHSVLSNLGWRIIKALPFRNVLLLPDVTDTPGREETNINNDKCSTQAITREQNLDNNNVDIREFGHNIRDHSTSEHQQTSITPPTRTPTLRTDTSRAPASATSTLETSVLEKSSSGTSTLVKPSSETGISILDTPSLGTPTTPTERRPTLRMPTLRTPTVRQFPKEQILEQDMMKKEMSEGKEIMEDTEYESLTETQVKDVFNEMDTDLEANKQSTVMQKNIIRQTPTKHCIQTLNSRTPPRRRETIMEQETTQDVQDRDNPMTMKCVSIEQQNLEEQSAKEEDQLTVRGGNATFVTVKFEEQQKVYLAVDKPVEHTHRPQGIASEMLIRKKNELVGKRLQENGVQQGLLQSLGQILEQKEEHTQKNREESNTNGDVKRTGRKRGKMQTHNIELNNTCDGVRIAQVKVVFVPNDSDKEIRDVVERGNSPPKKVLKKDIIENRRKRRGNLKNEEDTPKVMNVNFITVDSLKDEHKENERETDAKELEWKQRIKKGKHKLLSMKQTSMLCLPVDSNSPSSLSFPLSPVTFLEVHQSTPPTAGVRGKTNK